MQHDSIETLLSRHYGSNAPAPEYLEQCLLRSVQQEARVLRKQQQQDLQARRISRRQVVRMVAIGSAGLGLLSAGLESLQQVEAALAGQDTNRVAAVS